MRRSIFCFSIFLVVFANLISANTVKSEELNYWEQRAGYFMEQGEWRKAFTSAFNALHETAENSKERARLYTKIGHLFFHFKKNYGDSEGYYGKALHIDPYNLNALIGIGDVYSARKEFRGALHYYELAEKYHPNHFQPCSSIAAANYELAEDEIAMQYYEKALALNPNDVVSINNYANIFYDKKRLREARILYLRSLAIDSHFTTAHNNLGNLYMLQREFNEAYKHFSRALELDYDDASIHSNIANFYFEVKQVERAKYHLRKAVVLERHPVFHNNLAVMEKFSDEELNAGIQYAKALSGNPAYSNAKKNAAFFRKRSHTIQEARESGGDHFYFLKFLDGKGRKRRMLDNNIRLKNLDRFSSK